jgi:hypothetical protein
MNTNATKNANTNTLTSNAWVIRDNEQKRFKEEKTIIGKLLLSKFEELGSKISNTYDDDAIFELFSNMDTLDKIFKNLDNIEEHEYGEIQFRISNMH